MSETGTAPTTEGSDSDLFGVLDDFVESLHRGDAHGSQRLSRKHFEHSGLLECLAGLDRLAIPPGDATPEPARDATREFRDDAVPTVVTTGPAGIAEPDQRFGKFELLEEVGRGGMGVVYRARQAELDRIVAVKMILGHRLASPDDVTRFRGEARAAAGLRHANVVGIHEVGEVDGHLYFTMDYVAGPNLDRVLADGPLDVEVAARLVSKLAHAVQYLHDNGILHRDLKPSNVILDAGGEPHVTDFGLAKVFSDDSRQTRTGTIIGTASYMAPEQASGQHDRIGPRSDVYGLAAILYELVTGRPPFREEHPLDTLVQVLESEPTLPSRLRRGVPRSLERVCLKALEKNPEARYASAAEFANDLDRFLRDEPVEARRGGPVQRLRRWARRQPALAARLAAIGVVATIVQTRFLLTGGDLEYHSNIMAVMCAWMASAVLFQWLVSTDRSPELGPYGWVASDAIVLTIQLWISERPIGPLVIGYPLVIAAAGMFFRTRYVVAATIFAIVAYLVYAVGTGDWGQYSHYPLIFAGGLAVFGGVVGYQVHRVRALSRYYGDRLVP